MRVYQDYTTTYSPCTQLLGTLQLGPCRCDPVKWLTRPVNIPMHTQCTHKKSHSLYYFSQRAGSAAHDKTQLHSWGILPMDLLLCDNVAVQIFRQHGRTYITLKSTSRLRALQGLGDAPLSTYIYIVYTWNAWHYLLGLGLDMLLPSTLRDHK